MLDKEKLLNALNQDVINFNDSSSSSRGAALAFKGLVDYIKNGNVDVVDVSAEEKLLEAALEGKFDINPEAKKEESADKEVKTRGGKKK